MSDVIHWASVDGKDCHCIGCVSVIFSTYFVLNMRDRYGADAGSRHSLHHDRRQRGILTIDVKEGGIGEGIPTEHGYTRQGRDRTRRRRGRRDSNSPESQEYARNFLSIKFQR